MRKLLKSKKALSPVVAAIILIAVTVAVSIAVAAWMGSLSMGFMETKELTINAIDMDPDTNTITIYVSNTGTGDVTVSSAKVNGQTATITSFPIAAGVQNDGPHDITGVTLTSGSKYTVSLLASDGTIVCSYTDTA